MEPKLACWCPALSLCHPTWNPPSFQATLVSHCHPSLANPHVGDAEFPPCSHLGRHLSSPPSHFLLLFFFPFVELLLPLIVGNILVQFFSSRHSFPVRLNCDSSSIRQTFIYLIQRNICTIIPCCISRSFAEKPPKDFK